MPLHCTCDPPTCGTLSPPTGCTCKEDVFFKNATCGFTANCCEADEFKQKTLLCKICSSTDISRTTSNSSNLKPCLRKLPSKPSIKISAKCSESSISPESPSHYKPKAIGSCIKMSQPKGCDCELEPNQSKVSKSPSRLSDKCSIFADSSSSNNCECKPKPECSCKTNNAADSETVDGEKNCVCCGPKSSQRSMPIESTSRPCDKCSQESNSSPTCDCKPKPAECSCSKKKDVMDEGKCACCESELSQRSLTSKSFSRLCEKCSEVKSPASPSCECKTKIPDCSCTVKTKCTCCEPKSSQRSLSSKSNSKLCESCSQVIKEPTPAPSCQCKRKPPKHDCSKLKGSNINAGAKISCTCETKPSQLKIPTKTASRPTSPPSCQCKQIANEKCCNRTEANTNADKGCACCASKTSQRSSPAKSQLNRMHNKKCQCKPKVVESCCPIDVQSATGGKYSARSTISQRSLPSKSPGEPNICDKCSEITTQKSESCQCNPISVESCCPIQTIHSATRDKSSICCEPQPINRQPPDSSPPKICEKCSVTAAQGRSASPDVITKSKPNQVAVCRTTTTDPVSKASAGTTSVCCEPKASHISLAAKPPPKLCEKCSTTASTKSGNRNNQSENKTKPVSSCLSITRSVSKAAATKKASVCCDQPAQQLPKSSRICKKCSQVISSISKVDKPRAVTSCCINVTEPSPTCDVCGNVMDDKLKVACKICGNEKDGTLKQSSKSVPPICEICGNEDDESPLTCDICGNEQDKTLHDEPATCEICGNEEDDTLKVPAPKCDTCGIKDEEKICITRNQKKDSKSPIAQKFGEPLPKGEESVSEVVPPVNGKSGCTCRYPPAFDQIRCTGQITGSCQCQKNGL